VDRLIRGFLLGKEGRIFNRGKLKLIPTLQSSIERKSRKDIM
jgi:hypothetical protein